MYHIKERGGIMNKDERKIAIYSRKSKYTGKGDSIGNQVELCKRNLELKFPNIDLEKDIIIYEDEGFTGANTNRPHFKEMVSDIKANKIKCVCCYKLDRISRNVLDFSELQQLLDLHDVAFVSITENFDTNTPMGKAMLTITSAFAQLERDTIAERIRDNMMELAKTGRWLGGTTPTGFRSEKMTIKSSDGKDRNLFKLSPIHDEQEVIKMIFGKYKELGSQTKVETYLIKHDIKTKNKIDFSRFAIKNILQNPVYAIADEELYHYYDSMGVEIYAPKEAFDGKYGLMVYNKTEQKGKKRQKVNDIKDWIISVGKHKGIISGKDFIEIQNLITKNGDKSYRKPVKNNALLSGLLRCSKCGSFMRPKLRTYKNSDGDYSFTYLCELKEKSRGEKCNCKNPNGNEIDKLVMDTVKNMVAPNGSLYKALLKISKGTFMETDTKANELITLKKQYQKNETDIESFVNKIMVVDGEALEEVNKRISELKAKNKTLLEEMKKLEDGSSNNQITDKESASIVLNIIDTYFTTFDTLNLDTRRTLLKTIIDSVETDGETLTIHFIGASTSPQTKNAPLCDNSK